MTTDSSMSASENGHTGGAFVICDLRPEWDRRPYVTFWRPDDAGYAYPLSWAGDYDEARLLSNPGYYTSVEDGLLVRFPIARATVEALAIAPAPGVVDGDAGPVVRNTSRLREKLRRLCYAPSIGLAGAA